jgi:hypothetical protein
VSDGKDLLRNRFLATRYSAYVMMFTAVIISLIYGAQGPLVFVGSMLLLGVCAGSFSLDRGWPAIFRTFFGVVTIMSAFWAQWQSDTPFYVGWTVLLLGLTATLLGGIVLETRYLAEKTADPYPEATGLMPLRRVIVRMGSYMLIVTVLSLLAVLSSFVFALGTFPIWAVGICTAVLVLMFAYLVSRSADAADQSG